MIFKSYRYLVVNSPISFLFIIPTLIFLYSASLNYEIINYKLEFGTCEILKFTFDASNKFLYNVLGVLLIISSIMIQFFYLKNASIIDRKKVYSKWRMGAIIGFIPLIIASLGIYCNVQGLNKLNLEQSTILGLSVIYLLMIIVSFIKIKDK